MSYLPEIHRQLPQSLDAEKGVLGSILLSPDKVMAICLQQKLTPDWFHSPHHGQIFKSLLEMKEAGKPVDLISLTQFLEDHKVLDQCGGAACITELFTFVPTASNVAYYVEILREKHALRLAILECTKLAAGFYEATSVQEVYNATTGAFKGVQEICVVEESDKDWDQQELLAFMDKMQAAADGKGATGLMHFGLPMIDSETGGAQRGELVVIHGATSTGKSLTGKLLTQMAVFERGERAAVFSIEMMHEQCLRRYIADLGTIPLSAMRKGIFSKREMDSFSKTVSRISAAPLSIYDVKRNEMTQESIEREIRKVKKNKGLDVVMVDYLQLIRMKRKSFKENDKRRDQELQSVSTNLKLLAQELDLLMILVAQANEAGSCFDSSQVESDADWVFNMMPTYKQEGKIRRITGTNGLWISKAREGERGRKVPLEMIGSYARIQESQEAVRCEDF